LAEAAAGRPAFVVGQVARGAESVAAQIEEINAGLGAIQENVVAQAWDVAEQVVGPANIEAGQSIVSSGKTIVQAGSAIYGTVKAGEEIVKATSAQVSQHADRVNSQAKNFQPPPVLKAFVPSAVQQSWVRRQQQPFHDHNGVQTNRQNPVVQPSNQLFNGGVKGDIVHSRTTGKVIETESQGVRKRIEVHQVDGLNAGHDDIKVQAHVGGGRTKEGEYVPRQPLGMGHQPAHAEADTPMGHVHVGYSAQHHGTFYNLPNLY
jgi:hypothetical protein